jgi:hypothetical protein
MSSAPSILRKAPDVGKRDVAKHEMARFEKLESTRKQVFDSVWQTLSQYNLPNLSDINETKTEDSTGWMDRIFDTTAIEAARTCTTGQCNWAIPSAEPWFQWSPPDELDLDDDDEANRWCGICTDIALKELARSNYYRVSGMQIKSRTVFGTGHMHIEEGIDSLLNCTARKIGTYCVALNDDGIVDTVYSKFKLTARVAAQKFGEENLGGKVKKALEQKDGKGLDTEFWFLHVIRPRGEMDRDPRKIDAANKPIASLYIQFDDKFVCKEGGYDEMPDSVTRFDEWGSETPWGYSPAFETLPNARQLNYIVRFQDAQYELRANPRILTPATLFGQIDLRPGGVTPYDPNVANGAKPEEWMTEADVHSTEESAEKKRMAVNRLYYVDVFRALASMMEQYKKPPTAYQVQQVLGERLEQLSPMFGRLITEKCGPDLKRVFGILFRAGKFPRAPRSMIVPGPDGRSGRLAMPEITYTSRLALALKALQNRATLDTFELLTNVATNMQRPDVLDSFDLDHAIRGFAINQGMSPRYIRPMQDVLKLRKARADQMQKQQSLEATEKLAGAAGKLGKAPQKLQDAVSDQIPGA